MTTKKSKPEWQMPQAFYQEENTLGSCCGVLEIGDLDASYYDPGTGEIPVPKRFSPRQKEQIETYFGGFEISLLATTCTASQSDEERILRACGFKMLQNFTGRTGNKLRLWFRPRPTE